ncbi:hypothetical protein Nizo2766_2377 [Lactiplantibacillus plantarum]|nr:hypothetical protein Nizo2766_2377 [Lactiplantibacillus plantarum]KZU48588.1 hypothetical protein Nizo2757_0099 [Lactiplantibacillus plantarum]
MNPKSYVPALKVDNEPLMTECAVILEFIGLQFSKSNLPTYNTQEY